MWDIGRNKNDTKSTSKRGDKILIDMKTKVIQNHVISTNKRKDQMCIMKNNMIIIKKYKLQTEMIWILLDIEYIKTGKPTRKWMLLL